MRTDIRIYMPMYVYMYLATENPQDAKTSKSHLRILVKNGKKLGWFIKMYVFYIVYVCGYNAPALSLLERFHKHNAIHKSPDIPRNQQVHSAYKKKNRMYITIIPQVPVLLFLFLCYLMIFNMTVFFFFKILKDIFPFVCVYGWLLLTVCPKYPKIALTLGFLT